MDQRPGEPPDDEELQRYSLGRCEPSRALEIEAFLANGPDCSPILQAAAEDALIRHLREAASLSQTPTVEAAGTPGESEQNIGEMALRDHPRYRLIRMLGQGGMGIVYLAEHRLMRRLVAIKLIRAGCLASPHLVLRFRQEVRAAASLSHPHIVTSYDADEIAGVHFLVMEFIEGESLAARLARQGPLPVAEACDFIRQAAMGLAYAHAHGMVHRDIKPHNLMLAANGVVKILDFGLARILEADSRLTEGAENDTVPSRLAIAGSRISHSGTVMGTAAYMAPEQARDSRDVDIRGDVYSLGCTLYHLLTGHVSLQVKGIDVPTGLMQVIARMMATKPDDRYQTPGEVAVALEPFVGVSAVDGGSVRSKRSPRWLAAVLVAVLLFGGLALVAVSRYPTADPMPEIKEKTLPSADAEPVKLELVRRIPLVGAAGDCYYHCAISRGGKYALITRDIAPGSRMDVFDVRTGAKTFECDGLLAHFLGDGERILLPAEGSFQLYESHSGKLLRESEEKHRGLWNFKVAPGAKHIVYWYKKGYVLFDVTQMREQHHWDFRTPGFVWYEDFHFTADGKRVLLHPGRDEAWTVWDMDQNRASEDFPGLAANVETIAWLFPDGKTAGAIRKGEGLARLDMQTGKVVQPLQGLGGPGSCGRRLFIAGPLLCCSLPGWDIQTSSVAFRWQDVRTIPAAGG